MPQTLPPYALTAPVFRFRHLAAFAGKAPIGGAREVALAALVAARLAADCREEMGEEPGTRPARCAGARTWLGTLALPPAVRAALTRCVDVAGSGTPAAVSQEMVALAKAVSDYVDAPARGEIEGVAAGLRG